MATMIELAEAFFVSCDTGGGWEKCKTFCTPTLAWHAKTRRCPILQRLAPNGVDEGPFGRSDKQQLRGKVVRR